MYIQYYIDFALTQFYSHIELKKHSTHSFIATYDIIVYREIKELRNEIKSWIILHLNISRVKIGP